MPSSLQRIRQPTAFGLLGPVLFYDLVRQARRSRYIMLRCLYAGALAFVLYWLYYHTVVAPPRSPIPIRIRGVWYPAGMSGAGPVSTPNRVLLTTFAEQFFNQFMILQFAVVLVLAPVYAASCITEEKERKTLEHLLATDLSDREIIFSKLLARVANLGLIVGAGLPILSAVQILGGIDPGLVLAGFAVTAITMVSLTSLSLLASVCAKKSRDAILVTYLVLGAYIALGYLVLQLQKTPWAAARGLTVGNQTWALADLFERFNAGNLPVVLGELQLRWVAGTSLASLVVVMLRNYLIFHAIVAACCTLWSIRRLRRLALTQSSRPAVAAAVVPRPRIRPRLALQPMVWKEIFVEQVYRPRRLTWILFAFLFVLSFLPGLWVYLNRYLDYWLSDYTWMTPPSVRGLWANDPDDWNSWARLASTILASVMLLAVAARASTSISGERERDTLDALLAAPLRSHDILFGKWLGSLLSVRWVWLWLGAIWLVAIANGGLHPLAVPLSIIIWLVYASFLAGLGLWFSIVCRTSLRALFYTLGAAALLYGGSFLGAWALYYLLPFAAVRWLASVLTGIQSSFTPPVVFYWVGASPRELNSVGSEMKILVSLFGLFLWALAALFLWTITRSRFRRITSRMSYRRPRPRAALLLDSWGPTGPEEVLQGSVSALP
jgi:ABC-type transport system involved in multi-copper enzyme maturation permease subunit